MQRRSAVAGAAVLLVAGLIAAGCGESQEDAENALCADLATLRTNVQTLADTSADTTVEDFEQARANVRESWADVKASADNLGDERFDDVEDAWEDVADSMDDVDDKDSLAEAKGDIQSNIQAFQDAKTDLNSGIDCQDTSS